MNISDDKREDYSDIEATLNGWVTMRLINQPEKEALLEDTHNIIRVLEGNDISKKRNLWEKMSDVVHPIIKNQDELMTAIIISFIKKPRGTVHPIIETVDELLKQFVTNSQFISENVVKYMAANKLNDKYTIVNNALATLVKGGLLFTSNELEPVKKIRGRRIENPSSKKYHLSYELLYRMVKHPKVQLKDTLMITFQHKDRFLLLKYKEIDYYPQVSKKFTFFSTLIDEFSSKVTVPAPSNKKAWINMPESLDLAIKDKLKELSEKKLNLPRQNLSYKKELYLPRGNSPFGSMLISINSKDENDVASKMQKYLNESEAGKEKDQNSVALPFEKATFVRLEDGIISTIKYYTGEKNAKKLAKVLKTEPTDEFVLNHRCLFWAALELIKKRVRMKNKLVQQRQLLENDIHKDIIPYIYRCFNDICKNHRIIDKFEFARLVLNNYSLKKGLLCPTDTYPFQYLRTELNNYLKNNGF